MKNVWELIRLVMRLSLANSRRKTTLAIVFMLAGELAMPVIALALRFCVNAIIAGDRTVAAVAAVSVALAWITQLTFWHFGYRFYFDLLDLNMISLDQELIHLVNGSPSVGHVERAGFADKLEMLRGDTRQLYWSFGVIFSAFGVGLQLVFTGVLLAWLAPGLLVVPLFAVPALLIGRVAEGVIDRERERTAERRRQGRHLLELLTSGSAAKEIRMFGLQQVFRERTRTLWDQTSAELWRSERRAMMLQVAGQVIFALAYIGALILLVSRAIDGRQSIGDVLLVVALTGQINQQLARALREVRQVQTMGRSMDRYRWLHGAAAEHQGAQAVPSLPPERLSRGIELRDVVFTYPDADRPVLNGVDLLLPAGSVVGLVGENGSGKTTLIKLLCMLYRPNRGAILVDGTDLADVAAVTWRSRTSAGFQDFQRFEFLACEAVGVGQLARADQEPAVMDALHRAGARDLVGALPAGLATRLGRSYAADGHEPSGGQWQMLALGRAMMRDDPLLLVLDEPTASLDANAEHVLFERYAAESRRVARANGGVCILVSHRFSTVRMADLIVVLDHGTVAEVGSHDDLIASGGLYADLYRIQEAGYR